MAAFQLVTSILAAIAVLLFTKTLSSHEGKYHLREPYQKPDR